MFVLFWVQLKGSSAQITSLGEHAELAEPNLPEMNYGSFFFFF